MSNPEPAVQLRGISKSFPGVRALHDVSLDIKQGEVFGLIGENGAGKSTLVKILAGIYRKDKGEILLYGNRESIEDPVDAQRKGLSFILQDRNLCPHLSIQENIFGGRQPLQLGAFIRWKKLHQETGQILRQLQSDLEPGRTVASLSVAEQQLVEIGRAISFRSRVIIMDEPTASISEEEVGALFALIRGLKEQGITVMFISHRLKEVLEITDRVAVLRDGELVKLGETRAESVESLIRLMVGRDIESVRPQAKVAPKDNPVLSVRELCLQGHFEAISFELREGEILGFAGLVGAKRTELFQTLFGRRKPTSGQILLRGKPVRYSSPREALRLGIAYLSENRKEEGLFPFLEVDKNISMAALEKYTRFGFIDRNSEREAGRRYIDSLKIKVSSINQLVNFLSGGNQQKTLIARELLTSPQIVLLDEPTVGIDVGAKFEIYNILADLAAQGVSILLISSELNELLRVCHRIIVMCQGRMTGEFKAEEATQESLLARATQFERRGTVESRGARNQSGARR